MSGRHRVLKPGEWYCDQCQAVHRSACPCCPNPIESEPAYLRAFWSVWEALSKITKKSS